MPKRKLLKLPLQKRKMEIELDLLDHIIQTLEEAAHLAIDTLVKKMRLEFQVFHGKAVMAHIMFT